MLIIGIAGKMRSGKTSLAHRLANYFRCDVLSWAEAVRREVSKAWFPGWTPEKARAMWLELESRDKAHTRPILQAWGHGRRLCTHPDYWISEWTQLAERQMKEVVIIDDVRYPNEVKFILEHDGILIRLECDVDVLTSRGASLDFLKHASENSLASSTLAEVGDNSVRVLRLNSDNLNSDALMQTTLEWLWDGPLGGEEDR